MKPAVRAALALACGAALAAPGAGSGPAGEPTARAPIASGKGSVRAQVTGPISFGLRVSSATVEVRPAASAEVKVTLEGQPGARLALHSAGGDRLEPEFDGQRRLKAGKLLVEVPRGSRLDLTSRDGRIAVRGVGGPVRARASSGDLDLIGAGEVDAEAIDGEIDVLEASGPITVRTVSGKVTLSTTGSAPRLSVETGSGDVEWRGACARGCRLDVDTVSGQLRFLVDPASSFTLGATSHSGQVRDQLGLRRLQPPAGEADAGPQAWLHAAFGQGEGEVECESFSGDVLLLGKPPAR